MRRADDGPAGPGAAPFDWDEFQSKFFEEGVWKEAMNAVPGHLSWVDKYVRDLLSEMVPTAVAQQPAKPSKTTSAACNVFETHRFVIVRIKLTADADPQDVKLYVGANELKLTGLPEAEVRTVKLPANVRADGAKAVYKNGVLEVMMPKEGKPPMKEIPVRFADDKED